MATGMTEELISVREAAKECGRNMETIRRWIWAGKLPAEKLGNQLFIKKDDFASFCRETATLKYDTKSRLEVIKRLKRLREEIRARTGKVFDAETMIRELRDERDREVR